MPFDFVQLDIPDIVLVEPTVFDDARGIFLELYRSSAFRDAGIDLGVTQANHSRSSARALRGLHYQLSPHQIGKLVTVMRGAVRDVAVDVRQDSPWHGQHVAVDLTGDNHRLLWIPPGFAHGLCALEDDTEVLYLQTGEYEPDAERGVHPLDPALGIEWPFPVGELLLSERDRQLPLLAEAESNFQYGDAAGAG